VAEISADENINMRLKKSNYKIIRCAIAS